MYPKAFLESPRDFVFISAQRGPELLSVLCSLKGELWSHKCSMFMVVIMKSQAEMSFGGEKCFPVFAWQCMLYRNMTAIQITFTAYQTGNPLSSGERQRKAHVPADASISL